MPEDQTDSGDTMKTIAIIDDDIHIGDMLEEILTKEGYSVLRAYSGTEALYLLSNKKMDLVLLDLMLPGLSGEEVLPHIGKIPVIVLSAKVDVQDKVNLLLGGAADYMTKPFDTKELLARITVQLRRAEQHGQSGVLSVGDLALDTETFSLTVQGQAVKLTRTEYAILKLLMENHRLPHTMIFYGDDGLGKTTAAFDFADFLTGASEKIWVEIKKIKSSKNEKLLENLKGDRVWYIRPMGMELKIDQFRAFMEEMASFDEKLRVCIIDDAQKMNQYAANSFLKTLEEPVENLYFILVTSDINALLPTIVSRGEISFLSVNGK